MTKLSPEQQKEKIKALGWQYFKKQKFDEIKLAFFILFVLISIAGVLVQFGWECKDVTPDEDYRTCAIPYEPSLPIWMMITGFVTTGIWILMGIGYWLYKNYEKAMDRAEKEVKGE